MIRKLQLKFVAIMMSVLVMVFAVVFLTLNLFMRYSSEEQTDALLYMVAERDGVLSPPGEGVRPEGDPPGMRRTPPRDVRMRSARFFYVKVDAENTILETRYDLIYGLTEEEAQTCLQTVLSQRSSTGTVEEFQFLIADKDYGKIIVFAERSAELQLLSQLIYISLLVAGLSCVVLLVFSVLLSRWAVRPVKAAFDKQRRFVSDASHELKTPLTIIAANADVLENEIGSNIRIAHIREQAGRMNALILDLLALAKTDEGKTQPAAASFDLSQAALGAILEFESRAFEEKKRLAYEIEEGIHYTGDEGRIRQVLAILMDNAVKHSNRDGTIQASLKRANGKVTFSVFNTGNGIGDDEKEKIFERFYRSDHSRSRETGGYGLGLAIAKSIVEHHKGKISVAGKTGEWIRFTVTL